MIYFYKISYLKYFSKIGRENSSFIKNRTRITGTLHGGQQQQQQQQLLLLLLLLLFTAIGMSPSGSGYFTCKQNMTLVTTKFKSGGLHEKHVVATWNLGNHLSICEIIIIFIYCNWVVTRWQWLFYMQTKHEIGYY